MADHVLIDRAVVQQALEALEAWDARDKWRITQDLRAALAQAEPVQAATTKVRPDRNYCVEYRCKDCFHWQYVTEVVRAEGTYVGSGANWCDSCGGLLVRVETSQQQAKPAQESGT